ncbi:MAG: polysaccharide biosynthesis protein [Clostridia bacterium]|nr:polysaccharide biosynthesis protein [Clostridia bacterium]
MVNDRRWKTFLLLIADVVGVVASAFFAYLLMAISHGEFEPIELETWIWLASNVVVAIALFVAFGLYKMVLRSVSVLDGLRICGALGVLTLLNVIFVVTFAWHFGFTQIRLLMVLAFVTFFLCYTAVLRFIKRVISTFRQIGSKEKREGRRVLVIGAGDAGTTLIKEMLYSDKIDYKPVCILDDNRNLKGKHIHNVTIVGDTTQVLQFVEKYEVDEIIIALPSVSREKQKEIIHRCSESGLPIRMLPGIYQLANGQVSVSSLRDVDVRDLLGREQVTVNLDEIMGYIEDQTVLVTGGGGSIGSELCRQIASHAPKELIILDIYENNAYEIEQELKRAYPDLKLLALIASVRDKRKIEDVFEKYRPDIVFNAAAHKHVPLMETSPNEAVKNNVFGTLNVARAADKYEAKTFVQISTDKAVNPTNIMGATKRICEMIIQTIGRRSKKTNFVAVRFGNVLGSNGSVIPLFKKQISEGGPVTVTHKDIVRYFMTIPEAVSLVLQAGAYAKGGQIFVLDMGEPVKIYDLAYNLIKLSGLKPGIDIEIKCTGLRPGEKLYEERLMEEEGLQKTPNGLINIARPIDLDEEMLWSSLDAMYAQAYGETDEMKETVKNLVPTYTIDKRESVAVAFMKQEKQADEAV